MNSSKSLNLTEVIDILKAQLPIDYKKIEIDAVNFFSKWDKDGSGDISLEEFRDPSSDGLLAYIEAHYPLSRDPIPNVITNPHGYFQYWDK